MTEQHIRICPGCGTENDPANLRCRCGVLLAGVDISIKQSNKIQSNHNIAKSTPETASVRCTYEDCGQDNPPGTETCLYCNRPLQASSAQETQVTQSEPIQSLVKLPEALNARYRIVKPMPARGAEAELLVVQALQGGEEQVAKIYRHGILPKRDVQERINKISIEHRVNVIEEGISEGHAYELMEFIKHGSLRDMLDKGPLSSEILNNVIHELAIALRAVHAVNLVHRDLKPENVLIRTHQPLDLVLTDFSISSVLDVTQRFTGVARTLPYASPESLSGVIDFKCDYWALGMIILEAALGKHPFAGLSEPVIMHHLTTRNIDTSTVPDSNLRKLVQGLLQRDPTQRWSDAEITRWEKRDTTLAAPLATSSVSDFREPYHLGSEVCHQPQQLAVALARNWKTGLQDIANGQLLAWFRDVQRDQNIVRLLIEMRGQASLSIDVQLLRLILKLAPGMPPVWKGETIELSTILGYANKALQGDTEAAHWLDNLYRNRVAALYAEKGNRQLADLEYRWNEALAVFNAAWQDKLKLINDKSEARDPDTIADFDSLMYGNSNLLKPNLMQMHARLLAMAYDNSWADRLRKRVTAEILALAAQCDWINALGDPQTMKAAELLVLEALLPEAKKSVAHQAKKIQSKQNDEEKEFRVLREQTLELMSTIRHIATTRPATDAVCEELYGLLDEYHRYLFQVRASGRTDKPWVEFKKQVLRASTSARIMQDTISKLQRHRAITAGWFNPQAIGFVAVGLFLLTFQFRSGFRFLALLGVAAFVAWRLIPARNMASSIRELGESF